MAINFLDSGQAAERLGLSRIRVQQLAKQGRIGQLVAGRYLFTPAELDAFAKIERPQGKPPKKSRNKRK